MKGLGKGVKEYKKAVKGIEDEVNCIADEPTMPRDSAGGAAASQN